MALKVSLGVMGKKNPDEVIRVVSAWAGDYKYKKAFVINLGGTPSLKDVDDATLWGRFQRDSLDWSVVLGQS